MFGLRIIIADEDIHSRKNLKDSLTQAGYLVIGEASDGRKASQMIFTVEPDLVILDAHLPVRDGFEVAKVIEEQRIAPVLMVSDDLSGETLDRSKAAGIYGILFKPVSLSYLIPAVEIAVNLFQRIVKMENENLKLKDTLETRKIVEKAKGVLMERKQMSESDAYEFMRNLSMKKCITLKAMAKYIIKNL